MFRLPIFYRQDNGPAGAGAPATTPTTPPASPPSSPPAALNPEIYNPDGQSWKDLYNGTVGGQKSLQSQHVQALATKQGQVDAQTALVQERDATITSLQTAAQEQVSVMAGLTEQAATIPDLLQRASYADRLEILAQFPRLMTAHTAQEVPGVDGADPTTVNVNPYMELIATTTLTGDALRTQLSQFAGALPEPSQAAPTSSAPVIPPQPEPAPESTRASTLAEIGLRMRKDPTNLKIQAEYNEALLLPKAMGGTQ